jgi:hypothetical protein
MISAVRTRVVDVEQLKAKQTCAKLSRSTMMGWLQLTPWSKERRAATKKSNPCGLRRWRRSTRRASSSHTGTRTPAETRRLSRTGGNETQRRTRPFGRALNTQWLLFRSMVSPTLHERDPPALDTTELVSSWRSVICVRAASGHALRGELRPPHRRPMTPIPGRRSSPKACRRRLRMHCWTWSRRGGIATRCWPRGELNRQQSWCPIFSAGLARSRVRGFADWLAGR